MESLFGALAIGGWAAVIGLALVVAQRQRRETWLRLGRELGLARARLIAKAGGLAGLGIAGERDGCDVSLVEIRARDATRITLVVEGRGRVPESLDLRPETLATQAQKLLGGKEVETGDVTLDGAAFIRGPESLLFAVLDVETRGLLHGVLAEGGRVAGGAVRTTLLRGRSAAPSVLDLGPLVERSLALIRRLEPPVDLAGRLLARFREELAGEMRLRTLEVLIARFANEPRVRSLLAGLLLVGDQELRLRAALALGGEGHAALLDLAACADGDNSQAVRAIRALGRGLPREQAVAILNDALRAGRCQVALAAIGALGQHGDAPSLARLATVLRVGDDELAAAAALALGRSGKAEAAGTLLAALAASASDRVRLAIVEALGAVGSASEVEPLRAWADADALDRPLKRAARQAIASIQARLPGAAHGQVSLTEDVAGEINLVEDDPAGRVSYPGPALTAGGGGRGRGQA